MLIKCAFVGQKNFDCHISSKFPFEILLIISNLLSSYLTNRPFFLKVFIALTVYTKINKGMYNCSLHQLITVVCAPVMRWWYVLYGETTVGAVKILDKEKTLLLVVGGRTDLYTKDNIRKSLYFLGFLPQTWHRIFRDMKFTPYFS
jgi:hypothetical protein